MFEARNQSLCMIVIMFLSHCDYIRPSEIIFWTLRGYHAWVLHSHTEFNVVLMVLCSQMYLKMKLQATPAMLISRISMLPLMSKWFFIPNIFSLYFFAFQLHLCQKQLTWSNGYLQVIFHALDIFSIIFATVCVEVKVSTRMCAILSAWAMYM